MQNDHSSQITTLLIRELVLDEKFDSEKRYTDVSSMRVANEDPSFSLTETL